MRMGIPWNTAYMTVRGFMVSRTGTYTVVIGAIHPVTGELFTQERTVRVLTEEEYKDWERAQRRLNGGQQRALCPVSSVSERDL